jgi:hypothetical protein
MKKDITYWLNYLLNETKEGVSLPPRLSSKRTAAINTAVEASTVNERTFRLRPQDRFIRDNIQSQDILVVSVGGNDIALLPCPCTICSMAGLMLLPQACTEKGCTCGTCPCDDYCCGCGPSLASCLCAFPPCLGYLRHLLSTRVEKYIETLTTKTRPSQILVCMIYYPDETPTPSWAGGPLALLGYNRNPGKLQALIRKAYQEGTRAVHISDTQVVAVPLFQVLDGKITGDYVQRVEPSPSGGRVMAQYILVSYKIAYGLLLWNILRHACESSYFVP